MKEAINIKSFELFLRRIINFQAINTCEVQEIDIKSEVVYIQECLLILLGFFIMMTLNFRAIRILQVQLMEKFYLKNGP